MNMISARFAAVLVVSTLILAGCEEFESLTERTPDTVEGAAQLGPDGARTVMRDVERPDLFNVTETGLWDGRPSLGGVWVAHPDVTSPERAKITNTKSGKTIEGALFRRERANPGPRIQVSSDAAAQLGLVAGQPSELKIVAVRQEEVEIEPAPLPIADEATDPVGSTEETDAGDGDSSAAGIAAGAAAGAIAEAGEPPQRKGFWARFRDSLRNKPAEETSTAVAAEASSQTSEDASVPDVETSSLDPLTTAAAAAIAEAESASETRTTTDAPSDLKNPYIQVGLFGQEANASAVAANLRQAGVVPQIRGQQSGGKTLWRVFVGPVASSDDQAELLGKIRRLGYSDAFLSPN